MIKAIFEGEYLRGWQVAGLGARGDDVFPDEMFVNIGKRADEYGNYQYKRVPNPDYGKLVDNGLSTLQEDTRRYIGFVLDPQDPGPEVKEAKRFKKVKARFMVELPGLVYDNKDDPAALAAAMCDRMNVIDAGTTKWRSLNDDSTRP